MPSQEFLLLFRAIFPRGSSMANLRILDHGGYLEIWNAVFDAVSARGNGNILPWPRIRLARYGGKQHP